MRGRKPLPTEVKRQRGNPGKRPLNNLEPKPPRKLPECPEFLDEEAKVEWHRIAPQLARSRVISELDAAALMAYCQAFSRWKTSEQDVQKYGKVILSPDKKFPVQNPHLAIANKAMEMMLKFQVEFGMTPSSRSRVQVVTGPQYGPTWLQWRYGGRGNYHEVKERTGWTDEQIKDAFEAGEIDTAPKS